MNEPFAPREVKIAVIGGGTGSFTLLRSLKHHTSQIAALVNMADDGGSTGQLRDELGVLPPGDIRQCLVALSDTRKLRDLFNYRFDSGRFDGHAFGNIFLTALEKMTGNFAEAVELASEVLNITGTVEPVTHDNVTLVLDAGTTAEIRGEFAITNAKLPHQYPRLSLDPSPVASERALRAIETADMVVIAPGNLYGSLAPALLVPGIGEALSVSKALKIYVANLVTKPGQTDGFGVADFAAEIERFAGTQFLDFVLYNTEMPSKTLLGKYAKEDELPVEFQDGDIVDAHYRTVGAALLSGSIWRSGKNDPIAGSRTLIRHSSEAVARALMEIYRRERHD